MAFSEVCRDCLKQTLPKALKTALILIKLTVPISFAVGILNLLNILPHIAALFYPFFKLLGISGDGALVFMTSLCLPLLAPVAIMSSLSFGMREIIILASMCLISHALPIECAIQKKAGSSYIEMLLIRIISSFVLAMILNQILPVNMEGGWEGTGINRHTTLTDFLINWGSGTLVFILRIYLILTPLMAFQYILERYDLINKLSGVLTPMMKLFGLPPACSYLWLIGNVVGLLYGGAIIMDLTERGIIKKEESRLVNRHLALSHSQIEDPLIISIMGVPILWLIIPRLLLAICVVWIYRIIGNIKVKFQSIYESN